jgi:hypothetical protein
MTQHASFYLAARFPTKAAAGAIYTPLQQIVYDEQDMCDLSVYRLKLNDVWHVVVLGEKPSDVLYQRIEALLINGTLVTLRPEALQYLQARRAQATLLAPWVEAHYDTPEE